MTIVYEAMLLSILRKFNLKNYQKIIKLNLNHLGYHGQIKSTAYVFNKTAYLSDCNGIDYKNYKDLKNLKYLIIDCLKINYHSSHFNLQQAINISRELGSKKTILTNLHTDLDYDILRRKLPKNIIPAYDGMKLNI